jgi:hypothetical protein
VVDIVAELQVLLRVPRLFHCQYHSPVLNLHVALGRKGRVMPRNLPKSNALSEIWEPLVAVTVIIFCPKEAMPWARATIILPVLNTHLHLTTILSRRTGDLNMGTLKKSDAFS